MPTRIEELRRMVENVNIHDDNRTLLRLIVEELDYLHGEHEQTRRTLNALRKSFQ